MSAPPATNPRRGSRPSTCAPSRRCAKPSAPTGFLLSLPDLERRHVAAAACRDADAGAALRVFPVRARVAARPLSQAAKPNLRRRLVIANATGCSSIYGRQPADDTVDNERRAAARHGRPRSSRITRSSLRLPRVARQAAGVCRRVARRSSAQVGEAGQELLETNKRDEGGHLRISATRWRS